ncbi:MAG TPA: hypothetical protein VHR18_13575 [Solirubrobacterales bacterium]|jgi:hypothetical protein|nr:hypothetical protein [Solirubrobacterales bacterium]
MKDRYSIAVGLVFVALVVVAAFNTIGGDGGEILGLDRQEDRWALPEFAVPVASGSLEGDANVSQDDCEVAAVPCPEDARRAPACQIKTPGALRVCDLFDLPLVISFWFTKGGDCTSQQDVVDSVYARYRDRVNVLSLDIRDDRDRVRELVHQHGWEMPVGYDRDGAVGGLFRIGVCPTIAYVFPGGTLQSASIGELTEAQLSARVERLLAATRSAQQG